MHWLHSLIDYVGASHPALLFVGMALLPLIGVPASPLWVAAGIRLGLMGGTCLALGALLVNISIGYWIARGWLREPLQRLMDKRGYISPTLDRSDETKLILLLRVTPGFPLCVQNYLLGLLRVGFMRYIIISIPIQAAYGTAFVAFGNSLSNSSIWKSMLAGAGIIGVGLAVSLFRRWINRGHVNASATP